MKILLLAAFLFLAEVANCQMLDDSTYKSNNGKIFTNGQEITLGLGSSERGGFKYIENAVSGMKLSSDYAGQKVKIWKVRNIKKGDINVSYLVFQVNKDLYAIKTEAALLAKEIE